MHYCHVRVWSHKPPRSYALSASRAPPAFHLLPTLSWGDFTPPLPPVPLNPRQGVLVQRAPDSESPSLAHRPQLILAMSHPHRQNTPRASALERQQIQARHEG